MVYKDKNRLVMSGKIKSLGTLAFFIFILLFSIQENILASHLLYRDINKSITEPPMTAAAWDTIGKYGLDSIKTIKYYSLYIEYFKQDNYKDAYKYWRYLFYNAPKFGKSIYVNGAKMVKEFAQNASDPTIKQSWIDTLMKIYDQRIEFFNQKGYVLGKKGSELFILNPSKFKEAYSILKESVALEENLSTKLVPYYLVYTSTLMLKNNLITSDQFIEDFNTANDIINKNIENGSEKGWESISQNVLDLARAYLDCDKLIPAFSESFKKNPDNLNLLSKYQATLESQGCTDNDLYFNLSERVFELDPTAKRAKSLGYAYYSRNNLSKAIDFYKKAIELEENTSEKFTYYMALADAYRKSGNYPAARAAANSAMNINPNDGTTYLFIGDLYASSATKCGSSDFDHKAVYWIAVDMYQIALSKGESKASDRIAKYSQYFPTKEEAFYQDPPVKEGDTYQIGCWINASTVARFNK